MLVTISLKSKKENEINKFLSSFYETDMSISQYLLWKIEYKNPIEASDIIGAFVDNIDSYDLKMWLCLDKNVYIYVTEHNGNDVIKYLFERFPY